MIIISVSIILYIILNNSPNNKVTKTIDNDYLNALKQKVQDFQKGNAAANKNNLKCYVDILYDNLKLNVDNNDCI